MPTLTKPDIAGTDLEGTFIALLHEWLKAFFDGGNHGIALLNYDSGDTYDSNLNYDGQVIGFPAAKLLYQRADMTNNLDGLGIHVTTSMGTSVRKRVAVRKRAHGKWQGQNKMEFTFWLKANVAEKRPDGLNSEGLVRLGSDRLYLLLSTRSNTIDLARKGISHVRAQSPGLVISSDYSMRRINCGATLYFDWT